MKGLYGKIKQWRTRRFMKTLPPIATREDDGAWILARFHSQIGRPFNPFSHEDRDTVRRGIGRAMVSALPKLFGE